MDNIKSSIGWKLLIIGLVLWILGALSTVSAIGAGAVIAAVGAVFLLTGPPLFWIGLIIVLIDWLISKFR